LHALLTHLWGGGWNRSSEMCEGNSGFSKAKADQIDPRVTDVDRWEQESIEDPRFVLSIPWKPVGVTVRQLIQKELDMHNVVRRQWNASELFNFVIAGSNGTRRRKSEILTCLMKYM